MQLIEVVTQVTAIAIVRARDETALRASEARYRAAFDTCSRVANSSPSTGAISISTQPRLNITAGPSKNYWAER